MTIKPILFNTEMVRAVIDGRKTVTRRVVKDYDKYESLLGIDLKFPMQVYKAFKAPCEPGDVLYVRETWNYGYVETSDSEGSCEAWFETVDYRTYSEHSYLHACSSFWYRADADNPLDVIIPWRPSIHMPREAARIWLRVKSVSVERLQEMHAEDSLHEGVKLFLGGILNRESPLKPFSDLWDSTVRPADRDRYGWDANPWVWRIAFERCEKPEGFGG